MIKLNRAVPPLALLLALGCAPTTTTPPQGTPTPSAGVPTAAPSAGPAASATPAPSAFKITGTVFDDEIAKVAGATITATAEGNAPVTATTAEDGTYTLSLPAGKYAVMATKPGWTRRTQTVTVAGDLAVNFGAQTDAGVDPYFLSNNPEIEKVDVKEDAPGGPLTMNVTLSEPITKDSQTNFTYVFQLDAGNNTEFLRASAGGAAYNLRADSSWDADGKVYTFKYNYAYLPSGAVDVTYTARLRQTMKDTKDPITREPEWEDMHILDAEGKALGKNRAQYAFLNSPLYTLAPELLTNLQYGYYTDQRRWNLTHGPSFTFTAAKDTTAAALTSVSVNRNETIGSTAVDLMTLRFNKPMRVAKDRERPEFTQLDLDKEKKLVIINVSKNKSGSSPVALGSNRPLAIEFSRDDANVVYLHFSANTFENYEWVEVTLDNDWLDPVGNRPDPAHSKLSGPVV